MSGIFEEVVEYGIGGYDPNKPNNNEVSRRQVEVPLLVANQRRVRERLEAAIAANSAFLALSSPTAAQTLTQVQRLTREANALIRLQLDVLADVADT